MINSSSGSYEYVEAIEDGKIVKVSKEYAVREGLFILKKSVEETPKTPSVGFARPKERERGRTPLDLDKYRKPLNYRKNNVVADLLDNFHWEVSKARKLRGWTRKKLADMMGVLEEYVKMIENGILPKDDFVLIAKLENTLGISLRKGQNEPEKDAPKESNEESVSEDDIDIMEAD